jgi:hypothetical protein
VAPEVTTGRVVVVVGGDVVVVVGGEVVVVDELDREDAAGSDEVVGRAVEDVVELGVDVAGRCVGAVLDAALDPGCSLATTTPIAMVAPVATRAADRVSRRRRRLARRLASARSDWGVELIGHPFFASCSNASSAGSSQAEVHLCTICDLCKSARLGEPSHRYQRLIALPFGACRVADWAPVNPTEGALRQDDEWAKIFRHALSSAWRHVHVMV